MVVIIEEIQKKQSKKKGVKYKSVTDVRKNWEKYVKRKIELEEMTKTSLSKENKKTVY